MIVSLGEALVDKIHRPDQHEPQAIVGGAPYNVAIALSRLQIDAGLVCPISRDAHGQLLADGLQSHGVHRCVEPFVSAPTAIAEVFTDATGHPRYVFHREGTADRAVAQNPPIASLPDALDALHFGSLTLAQEQDWPHWKKAISAARANGAFIAFDPNLRPALIDDMDRYRARLEEAIQLCDLIKASDEDLSLLEPGCIPSQQIQQWCSPTRIVVLTEGKEGARLWTQTGEQVVFPQKAGGPIVDTVGAGDTFQAALLSWLSHRHLFHSPLDQAQAHQLLAFANAAARLNCGKAGCQPPALAELADLV